jgi:hypothetical protein
VSRQNNMVTVIEPATWSIERTVEVAGGSPPIDIAVVNGQTAYIAREKATHLLRWDIASGTTREVVDLSMFADADGIPDLGTMAIHDGRLYVQVRRLSPDFTAVPPAYLAVIDLATEQIVDVDPGQEGVQAITLSGTSPKMKMQVIPDSRQLFVSATGGTHDAGGIERINLDSLSSDGLVIRESDGLTGADLGPFVMVSDERGFLSFTTDLDLSSHLHAFTLSSGTNPDPLNDAIVGYFSPNLEHDPISGSLFFPVAGVEDGVLVFDSRTGARLSARAIPTGGPPADIVLIPEPNAARLMMGFGIPLGMWWLRLRGRRDSASLRD